MTALWLLCAVVAVAAVGLVSYRSSLGGYATLRRMVLESDAALREAAAALGLDFVPGGSHEHPVVGSIPNFGSLRGSIDGVAMGVEVRAEELGDGLVRFSTEFRAGSTRVLPPNVPETGSSQAYLYRVLTDASALVRLLKELANSH